MKRVIGAFTTLAEAERTVGALLEAGHTSDAMTAHGRVGAGKLLLAGAVPVQPVGDPARLVSRAERARASAAGGALVAAILAALTLGASTALNFDATSWLIPPLNAWTAPLVMVVLAAILGGSIAALARRTDGLPHNLANRFGMRLDQGDTVISVVTAGGAETRAAQELMGLNGAVFAHATRGAVEPLDPVMPSASLAPSQN